MRVWLSDGELLDDLAAHLRESGFLVVRIEWQAVQAQPLYSVSDRRDRRALSEQVDRWVELHPGAQPTVE